MHQQQMFGVGLRTRYYIIWCSFKPCIRNFMNLIFPRKCLLVLNTMLEFDINIDELGFIFSFIWSLNTISFPECSASRLWRVGVMQISRRKSQPVILVNGFPSALSFKFTLKYHVMHESLNLWLSMWYLLSLTCISDIQYVKNITQKMFVEKY